QKRLADRIGVEAGREMIRAVELAREKDIRLEVRPWTSFSMAWGWSPAGS
ncbi:MAG: hypothetical protein HON56_08450, partial [Nitrospina sp.]|nr:hypothetical protein [Nitrospina sp.]